MLALDRFGIPSLYGRRNVGRVGIGRSGEGKLWPGLARLGG